MLLFVDKLTWASELPVWAVITGLVMLVIGAELLVRGAVWIALAVGMSRMAVGLTLVSIGTSLPELLVTLTAADGHPELAISNVLGSNIANVLLIVGVTASIRAIRLKTQWLEIFYMLLMTALACVPFLLNQRLERWLSAIMLAVLFVFLGQLLVRERAGKRLMKDEAPPTTTLPGWFWHCIMLAAGFATLAYGAEWLVEGAVKLAADFGMSEGTVGLTVVAIGTSLPELATSAVAALRGQSEICIGNVIGSNIFNVGAVLGGAGLLNPFAFDAQELQPTVLVTVGSALLLALILRRLHGVPRPVGLLLFAGYVGFTAFMVLSQTPPPA
ncbi:MAG: calcium/sodium antiporter [Planctomycetota bacterium]